MAHGVIQFINPYGEKRTVREQVRLRCQQVEDSGIEENRVLSVVGGRFRGLNEQGQAIISAEKGNIIASRKSDTSGEVLLGVVQVWANGKVSSIHCEQEHPGYDRLVDFPLVILVTLIT